MLVAIAVHMHPGVHAVQEDRSRLTKTSRDEAEKQWQPAAYEAGGSDIFEWSAGRRKNGSRRLG